MRVRCGDKENSRSLESGHEVCPVELPYIDEIELLKVSACTYRRPKGRW